MKNNLKKIFFFQAKLAAYRKLAENHHLYEPMQQYFESKKHKLDNAFINIQSTLEGYEIRGTLKILRIIVEILNGFDNLLRERKQNFELLSVNYLLTATYSLIIIKVKRYIP